MLECSPGLEVIEVSSPAEHETLADLELELPDAGKSDPSGTSAASASCATRPRARPSTRGASPASRRAISASRRRLDGLADARVVRRRAEPGSAADRAPLEAHDAELRFGFLLSGSATLHAEGRAPERLAAGDAFVIPAGHGHALRECGRDLELLELAVHPPRS